MIPPPHSIRSSGKGLLGTLKRDRWPHPKLDDPCPEMGSSGSCQAHLKQRWVHPRDGMKQRLPGTVLAHSQEKNADKMSKCLKITFPIGEEPKTLRWESLFLWVPEMEINPLRSLTR